MSDALAFAVTLGAILLCALLGFFFSGVETAVISVNRYRFRQRHEEGDPRAGKIMRLLANTPRLITAVLIGNNFSHVLLVLFFRLLLDIQWSEWAHRPALGAVRWGEAVSVLFLTPLIVIFAEILPKALFRARADDWIGWLRPILLFFVRIFYPIIWLLDMLAKLALVPFGGGQHPSALRITRGDVITMLNPPPREAEPEEGRDAGAEPAKPEPAEPETPSFLREPDERLLIKNIINLERGQVGEIMQPLVALEAVHLGHITMEEFLGQARQSGYSRYPVYRHRIVNIIGYIDVYDVIRDARGRKNLDDFVRPGYYVPETKRLDDLLQEFLEKRVKNAIVVDEYGGCCGWVSREDILEEIVGELEDELDLPTPLMVEQEGGGYLIEGRIHLEDLSEALGAEFDDSSCDTLGGALMKEMGRIPKVGEMIVLHGWRMEIKEMEGMRVRLVQVRPA